MEHPDINILLEVERELKSGYTDLIESIPDVIMSLEYPSGKILYINRASKEILGYEPEEFYGTNLFLKIINSDDRKEILNRWRNVKDEGDFPLFIYKVRKKDATYIWVEQKNRTVKNSDGKVIALNAVFRDISERKRLEEESHKNLLFSENLFLHSPYAILHIRSNGSIKRFNPTFERLWHLTPEDIGDYSIWKDSQLQKAGVSEILKEVLSGKVVEVPAFKYFIPVKNKTKTVYISGKGFPDPDRSKDRSGLIIIIEDVTEKIHHEEEYLEIKKLESIGRLAGGIAHDFNNILAGISGYAEILMRKIDESDPLHKFCENIHIASMKASTLTNQLLGFARRGKYNPDFIDIINPVIYAIGATPGLSSRIKVDREFSKTDMCVFGDVNQLRQVFIEILKNAAESIPETGTITIQTGYRETNRVVQDVTGQTPMKMITVTIQDTGSGIPEQVEGKIFDPYYTTKDKSKHAGMGLAVAYGIIRNHGGRIEITGNQSGGTTVVTSLPAVKKPGDYIRTAEKPYHNILIIDDSEETRSILRTFFEEKGCTVHDASGGKAGIELMKNSTSPYDLVFLDLIIPDMPGLEVLDVLRNYNETISIVVMAGSNTEYIPETYIDDRNIHILLKPFSLRDIETILYL
ncbi:MAG TPA: PAS domain S-box protein [Spirochaetota bacterium]|nr:PAS domain S-box protein [Spirochaetota bacterium]